LRRSRRAAGSQAGEVGEGRSEPPGQLESGRVAVPEQVNDGHAEYLDLLRKHSYAEELAPPDARQMAVRFLAIPQEEPPGAEPAPA